ncbi:MAG: hypothetical protein NTX14_02365 [Candidatus Nealsonbacteria bacterium]|nr:hypothetical protein [Candidatus Nealsonbacteria bacterium]
MARNKEITTNELAAIVKAGFEAADKRTDAKFEASDKQADSKIESLAKMVANGFHSMGDRIETLKQGIGTMQQDIGLLKQGQERIEMRLNNVVYRSE